MTTLTATLTSSVAAAAAFAAVNGTNRASGQEGILSGGDPAQYTPSNTIIRFIHQACIIILVCRALHYPAASLRQPRVVGEVLGGILLSPSVFGCIPGFMETIFPPASLPVLNNVASLGLIPFLFTIGLEVDLRLVSA